MSNYSDLIAANLENCLIETNLDLPEKYVGKTRDTYRVGDKLVLIVTDRHTSFDRWLANIPFKGQVLTQTSAWWFEQTADIVANHVVSVPDPNVTIGRWCERVPVEFVVRAYLTGSTSTSIWKHYQQGSRNFCGHALPEGMVKNQPLERPIVTPSTKLEKFDRSLSGEELISEKLISPEDWKQISAYALQLFARGQELSKQHGLILVDTKYEFGKDADGTIRLIDEIHTPDSSRYWIANSYDERFAAEQEPENIDKEFLRLWFADNSDPYKDAELPEAPKDLVIELSRRYIQLYEMITGKTFEFPDASDPIDERIESSVRTAMAGQ